MLKRATRPAEGRATWPWDAASGQSRYWRKYAARTTRGGLGVVGRGELQRARASRRSAPAHSRNKESVAKGCSWKGSAPPNGSRLSCGRNARRRKAVERQTKRLASEATQFFPT